MTGRQYRILVTGSRKVADTEAAYSIVYCTIKNAADNIVPAGIDCDDGWPMVTLVHGEARGLDRLAAKAAAELGMQVEGHPAEWDRHRKAAGPIRNQQMVDLGADVVLGFPLGDGPSGTRHCMERAEAAGLHVIRVTSKDLWGGV